MAADTRLLLTDELFAICGAQSDKQFNRWYALGAGLSFYLIWNLASLVGIVAGSYLPDLNQWGLEFAVAATFIAIVIPNIKSWPVLISVLTALVLSVLLTVMGIEGSLMFASIGAMFAGYGAERLLELAHDHAFDIRDDGTGVSQPLSVS